MFTAQSYLTNRPVSFQEVWFQESIKLQTRGGLLAQDKPQWTSSQKLLQLGVLHTKCQPYLVHRHYISQPHSEVVSDNFVEADLRLLNSVISKNNAHCVLALFALRIC